MSVKCFEHGTLDCERCGYNSNGTPSSPPAPQSLSGDEGMQPGNESKPCPECKGAKQISDGGHKEMEMLVDCETCEGSGIEPARPIFDYKPQPAQGRPEKGRLLGHEHSGFCQDCDTDYEYERAMNAYATRLETQLAEAKADFEILDRNANKVQDDLLAQLAALERENGKMREALAKIKCDCTTLQLLNSVRHKYFCQGGIAEAALSAGKEKP